MDNFAGGGGASTGIELATGYSVDIAINHDPEAIRMHKTNHPNTKHYCEDVWQVDPVEACNGHPVGLAWFSPVASISVKLKVENQRTNSPRACLGSMPLGWACKTRDNNVRERRRI